MSSMLTVQDISLVIHSVRMCAIVSFYWGNVLALKTDRWVFLVSVHIVPSFADIHVAAAATSTGATAQRAKIHEPRKWKRHGQAIGYESVTLAMDT